LAVAQALTPYRPVFLALLVVGYTLLAIVPMDPWPVKDAVDTGLGGSPTDSGGSLTSLFLLSLLALSLVIWIERYPLALHLLARTWPVALTMGWFLASVAWADYPMLTFKRTAFLIIGYLICLGIAGGSSSPWQVLRTVAVCFQVVLVVNLVSVFVTPAAMTDIGAGGMYGNKNIAGSIAMVGCIITTFVILYTRSRLFALVMGASLLLSLLFLVLTLSKTSIALVALFFVFLLPLAAALSFAQPLGTVMILLAGFGVAGFLFTTSLIGWDRADILDFLVGDPTFTGRTDIWDFVWPYITGSPVLGTGYGSFWDVGEFADPLRNARSWLGEVGYGVINQTHNGYIDLVLQTGLIGLFGLVLVLGRGIIRSASAMVRYSSPSRDWAPHAFVFSMLCLMVIYNLMETALFSRVHEANQFFVLFLALAERWRFPAARSSGPTVTEAPKGPQDPFLPHQITQPPGRQATTRRPGDDQSAEGRLPSPRR